MLIDGGPVALADLVAAARSQEPVFLDNAVLDRLRVGAEYAARVETERHVYGRSTGVGANRGVMVDDDDEHGLRLLRSHATSAGPEREPTRVRALLLARLIQLGRGGNGVRPEAAAGLLQLLDDPPPVREYVGLGTGDLGALGTVGLALADKGLWQPHGDALAFMSSNAATLADAALGLRDLRDLTQAGLVVAALSAVGVRGNPEAFAPGVEMATPFPGAREVCRTMRRLLDGAEAAPRIQDSFGLRTLPQVHGPLLDALDQAEQVTEALINAPAENPIISPALGVAHHGGFHLAYLEQALDSVRSALAQALQAGLGRVTMLADPVVTGLRPFLADDAPAASGVMVVEYAVAAALADVRALAQPAGLQTVSVSRGTEDDASFASLAARQAISAAAPARAVMAGELVCAMRAVAQGERIVPPALVPAVEFLDRAGLGAEGFADRDLTADLDTAGDALSALAGLVAELDDDQPG